MPGTAFGQIRGLICCWQISTFPAANLMGQRWRGTDSGIIVGCEQYSLPGFPIWQEKFPVALDRFC
jgi:hypothetical protein